MTVGDKGVAITLDAGGFSLAGSTCALLAAPGLFQPLGAPMELTPLTLSANALMATYTTTGTDFTASGEWSLQLQVKTASGQIYTSAPVSLYVNPLL